MELYFSMLSEEGYNRAVEKRLWHVEEANRFDVSRNVHRSSLARQLKMAMSNSPGRAVREAMMWSR